MHGKSLCSDSSKKGRQRLKILICSLNFSPELTGIGKYSGEMAFWLAQRGHEVRVVAAPPYYPDWKVREGYSSSSYHSELCERVRLIRCPLWVPEKPGGIARLIHLFSFAVSSFPVMLRHVLWQPDVVWVVAPAFFCAPVAWLVSRLSRSRSWLHIQDYEIDAAFDLGLLKGRFLKSMVLGFERWMLQRFDRVSTISHRMLERACGKGVLSDSRVFFPNWVDIFSVNPNLRANRYRSELNIPNQAVVALYSGNMGGKQGLGMLADAARLCADNASLFFLFCGNGAGRSDLESACKDLKNVRFLDLQPHERLGELLASADIHLLPQRADAADLVMPSKLTGMLASGRPVVATAHAGTEVARVVNGCGLIVPPEDAEAFSAAVSSLADDVDLRNRLGIAARNYAEANLDKEAVLRRFEEDLSRLLSRN